MEKKIKVYEVAEDDVYKISLVDEPAIESGFVYFGKEKPVYIALETSDKHLIYSPVLRPDFPIYRNYDGDEFYLKFTREAVEKSAHDFLKNGFQHQWSIDHQTDVEGLSVVESWIKTDENDKSISLGLDPNLEIGTWFVGLSVDNEPIWKAVKSGSFKGLSIEAFVYIDDEQIEDNQNKNKEEDMSKFDENKFFDRVKELFESALGSQKLAEEETPAETSGETVEEVVEEKTDEVVEAIEEVAETPEEESNALQDVVDALQERVDSLVEEVETLKKENAKLSKQPSTKEVKANAQQKKSGSREVIEALYNGTYFSK